MGNLWEECLSCKINCCKIDVAHPLFVTQEEIDRIKNCYPDKFLSFNKTCPCSCLLENGLCGIQENKPIDCRLFPFDIVKYNGSFLWIIREVNCSIIHDETRFEEYMHDFEEKIIPSFYRHLEEYSQFRADELASKYGFRILREVQIIEKLAAC